MPLTLVPRSGSDTLRQRIHHLRMRYRTAVATRAIARTSGFVLIAVTLSVLLDYRYLLPPLVRAFMLISTLGGVVLLLRRELKPLRGAKDDLAMALRIEARHPQLDDSLASAIQFEEQGAEGYGSEVLRQHAIDQASQHLETVDIDDAATIGWVRRSVLIAVLLLAGISALVISDLDAAQTGLDRLARPFGLTRWPTDTRLVIVSPVLPLRLAKGDPLELRVSIAGVIPERARISIWVEGSQPVEQSYPIVKADNPQESTLSLRIEGTRLPRDFRFRVRANDGDTGWQAVRVSPPPLLVPLDGRPSPQIHLEYPDYTELPAADLPDGGSVVDAVAGTVVTVRAGTDRPVQKAWMELQQDTLRLKIASTLLSFGSPNSLGSMLSMQLGREVWDEIPAALSPEGTSFTLRFTPRISGTYALHFEDAEGLGRPRLFDFRVSADPTPHVSLDLPHPSELQVLLPGAELPLRGIVSDKVFAIRDVYIEYRFGRDGVLQTLPLYQGNVAGTLVPEIERGASRPLILPVRKFNRPDTYLVDRRLVLSQLTRPDGAPLKEGDVIYLAVAATDYDNITFEKQPGRSHEVEIRIVSPSQLDQSLQQGLAELRNELLHTADIQRNAIANTLELLEQVRSAGVLQKTDIDKLIQTARLQQQITGRLSSPEAGAHAEINRMRQTIRDNHLPSSPATERVEAIGRELDRIGAEELNAAETALAQAKVNPDAAGAKKAQEEGLRQADRHEKRIEEGLRNLLQKLEPWSGAGEVQSEAHAVLNELENQAAKLQQLRKPQTEGKSPQELSPEQRAELERTAVRPKQLAERTGQLEPHLQKLLDEKRKQEEHLADLLAKKQARAKEAESEADRQPLGSEADRQLRSEADAARTAGEDAKDSLSALRAEKEALEGALRQADGSGLQRDLADAADSIRQNKLENATRAQENAAAKLQKLIDGLAEKPPAPSADELRKKRKEQAGAVDKLIEKQELLQKKSKQASKIADQVEREAALQKLAPEQAALEEEALRQAERLSRIQQPEAAEELRQAASQMAKARDQLEHGEDPDGQQEQGLAKLDKAQEQLEKKPDNELQREANADPRKELQMIRDKQQAAIQESDRLHTAASKNPKWDPLQKSNDTLIDRQARLAKDLCSLLEKRYKNSPVFERVLEQAAIAMEEAAENIKERSKYITGVREGDAHDAEEYMRLQKEIRKPQDLALRRLDQLLEALKPDPMKPETDDKPPPAGEQAKPEKALKNPLPPLAELKVLRAVQEELIAETKKFNEAHPDESDLNKEDRAELDRLKRAQIAIGELMRKMTQLAEEEKP